MTNLVEKFIEQFPALAGFIVLCYLFIGFLKWLLKSYETERSTIRAAEEARWLALNAEHITERRICREVTAANTIATTAKLVQEEKTIAAMNNLSHVIAEKFKDIKSNTPG